MRLDIEPNAVVAWHTHPGIRVELSHRRGVDLTIDGEGARTLAAGEEFQVSPRVPHSGKNGSAKSVFAATYVVEKGKPC